mmetsp:Transcript_36261/g.71339  ORF Transcript_36261/g.71339 Transcript_36261/m.71339 type:complete len:154 (-) Transcript_36261:99-560(-)
MSVSRLQNDASTLPLADRLRQLSFFLDRKNPLGRKTGKQLVRQAGEKSLLLSLPPSYAPLPGLKAAKEKRRAEKHPAMTSVITQPRKVRMSTQMFTPSQRPSIQPIAAVDPTWHWVVEMGTPTREKTTVVKAVPSSMEKPRDGVTFTSSIPRT